MSITKRTLFTMIGAAAFAVSSLPTAANAGGEFEPTKPIDFVIMAGKGGGADKMARLMQSVIEKNKLASKPFVPINKPGGSGHRDTGPSGPDRSSVPALFAPRWW